MNEETLVRALGGLRTSRMSDVASDRVREELIKAWRDRASRRHGSKLLFTIARPLAVAAIVLAMSFGTLRSSADSPLYSARVAVEDALVAFQPDPVSYLTALYDERIEEAARFEAMGNALAASRARAAQKNALRLLNEISPSPDEPEPQPSASTVITLPSSSPERPATPTPSPTAAPTPEAPPAVVEAPAPRTPAPTEKPATPPTQTPTPTAPPPTPMNVAVSGSAIYKSDGTPVDGGCISTSLGGPCIWQTTAGKFALTIRATKGTTVTLYFSKSTPTGTVAGKVTFTVSGTTMKVGTIALR
jgi:outer membrane biosynthesis protein TonB